MLIAHFRIAKQHSSLWGASKDHSDLVHDHATLIMWFPMHGPNRAQWSGRSAHIIVLTCVRVGGSLWRLILIYIVAAYVIKVMCYHSHSAHILCVYDVRVPNRPPPQTCASARRWSVRRMHVHIQVRCDGPHTSTHVPWLLGFVCCIHGPQWLPSSKSCVNRRWCTCRSWPPVCNRKQILHVIVEG